MPPYVRMRVPVEDEDDHLIGWVIWNELGERVDVDGGTLPAEFYLLYPGAADQPSLKASFGVRHGAVWCSGVSVDAKTHGREVIPTDLDIVRRGLNDWMEMAVLAALQDDDGSPVVPDEDEDEYHHARSAAVKTYRDARRRTRRKVTDELLSEVARLYRDHLNEGPWQAIQDRFSVSESTAGRYVLLARQAGHLPHTTPGKKKA
jgi:hypothetical protein